MSKMCDIVEYFRKIAEQHIELQHTAEEPAFFREYTSREVIFGESDFLQRVRKAKDTVMILDFNGDGSISGRWDNRSRSYTGGIMLLRKTKVHDFEAIGKARSDLLAIWDDIYARILKDIDGGAVCFEDFDCHIQSIGMIHDAFYGIAVFFTITERYYPQYNSDRWSQ